MCCLYVTYGDHFHPLMSQSIDRVCATRRSHLVPSECAPHTVYRQRVGNRFPVPLLPLGDCGRPSAASALTVHSRTTQVGWHVRRVRSWSTSIGGNCAWIAWLERSETSVQMKSCCRRRRGWIQVGPTTSHGCNPLVLCCVFARTAWRRDASEGRTLGRCMTPTHNTPARRSAGSREWKPRTASPRLCMPPTYGF